VAGVETERGLEVEEDSYSCTMTTPDDGIAKVSAPETGI
jgi:hypothetical protein